MTTTEARDGAIPEVRALAGRMITELQTKLQQMTACKRAWTKRKATPPDS